MQVPEHYADERTMIRKICVGALENNVYVVACRRTRRAVVIDAADEPDRVVAACRDVEPIAILTTHGHYDHVGAADAARAALGVPFRIHPGDQALAGVSGAAPLADGEAIAVGELTLRAVHTPGHTPGSTCFVLPGHVFSGDTLFPGGPGASGGAGFEEIIGSIRDRLFTLPAATLVHPGHGLATTIGAEQPSLDTWIARGW